MLYKEIKIFSVELSFYDKLDITIGLFYFLLAPFNHTFYNFYHAITNKIWENFYL